MNKNTGGSRALSLLGSSDDNQCDILLHLHLVEMLDGVNRILQDVYRAAAHDKSEQREPTLHNKFLLGLTPPDGMDHARFEELIIWYSLTRNEPDIEKFQKGVADTFGGKYTKKSTEAIYRLVKGEQLTPYADTETMLKYFTEENQQVHTIALFSNAWRYSKDEFDRVFGKYIYAIQQPARCQVVPFYSWMTGYAKPDPGAFWHALKTFGGKPENYLLIDDRLENVLQAMKMGMKAILIIRDNNYCPVRIPEGVTVIHGFEPLIAAFKVVDEMHPPLARRKRRPV